MDAPLDVATPERVALDLPLAGIGYRSLAYLVDALALFGAWAVLFFAATLVLDDVAGKFGALSGLAQTLIVLGGFAAQWLSWTLFETFWEGRTLGKRVMGIRVVRLDGSPVGFFEAATRNLARAIDFLPAFYAVGIVSLLVTRRSRRLGDLLAGTVVVRDVAASLDRYSAAPTAAAMSLAANDTELVLDFLTRAPNLSTDARERIAARLVERFGAHLPPEERERLSREPAAAEQFLRARAGAA